MNRSCRVALLLPCLAALLLARPMREPARPALNDLESDIQAELESHGERVMGKEAYRWSTRLEKISDCRAELKVRVTSNLGDTVVRTDSVQFSLGALQTYGLELQKNWLVLPCAGHEKCISSISTCTKTTKGGIVVDCTTVSQKREESFSLQLDGDSAASSRLERAFRQAVNSCHEPTTVSF